MSNIFPVNIFFHTSEDGTYTLGFNRYCDVPSRHELIKMRDTLQEWIDAGQDEIDRINHDRAEENEAEMREINKPVKIPVKKHGTIYVLRSGDYFKIGRSLNWETRRTKYITENPNEVEIVYVTSVHDYVEAEKILHDSFAHKRHRGEWFSLDGKDIEHIKSLLEPFYD
jgi:hypothetical protein